MPTHSPKAEAASVLVPLARLMSVNQQCGLSIETLNAIGEIVDHERVRLRFFMVSLLPTALLLAITILLFPSAGRDDTYITLWPAHTLAEHGEILNYNGERVEQSSTLLMVLLLAPFATWVSDLSTTAKLISLVAAIGCVLLLQIAHRHATLLADKRVCWIAAISTATALMIA